MKRDVSCAPAGTGNLQAYLDNSLEPEAHAAVEAHLAGCEQCRQELALLSDVASEVTGHLAALAPSGHEVPAATAALADFRRRVAAPAGKGTKMQKRVFLGLSWRPAAVAVAAMAALVLLVTVAPVRQAAADFLGLFRVRKFAVIPIDPAQAERLSALAQSMKESSFGEPVTLREEGQPQPVGSPDEASAVAGFPVRVPDIAGDAQLVDFSVATGPAYRFEIQRAELEALLGAAGVMDAPLPDVEQLVFEMDVPSGVHQEWRLGTRRLELVQMPSPEAALPEGVDPVALGEIALRFLGIPAADAQRLAQSIDWTSTVVIPLPTAEAQAREVTVDGTVGLLVEGQHRGEEGRDIALLWERDGILYGMTGNVSEIQLLQAAGSLQ